MSCQGAACGAEPGRTRPSPPGHGHAGCFPCASLSAVSSASSVPGPLVCTCRQPGSAPSSRLLPTGGGGDTLARAGDGALSAPRVPTTQLAALPSLASSAAYRAPACGRRRAGLGACGHAAGSGRAAGTGTRSLRSARSRLQGVGLPRAAAASQAAHWWRPHRRSPQPCARSPQDWPRGSLHLAERLLRAAAAGTETRPRATRPHVSGRGGGAEVEAPAGPRPVPHFLHKWPLEEMTFRPPLPGSLPGGPAAERRVRCLPPATSRPHGRLHWTM